MCQHWAYSATFDLCLIALFMPHSLMVTFGRLSRISNNPGGFSLLFLAAHILSAEYQLSIVQKQSLALNSFIDSVATLQKRIVR